MVLPYVLIAAAATAYLHYDMLPPVAKAQAEAIGFPKPSMGVFQLLFSLNTPIMVVSRSVQIMTNYSNKSTGALAFATCMLQFAGSGARVFTTMAEVDDSLMLMSCVVAFGLNALIMLQFMLYWSNASAKKNN